MITFRRVRCMLYSCVTMLYTKLRQRGGKWNTHSIIVCHSAGWVRFLDTPWWSGLDKYLWTTGFINFNKLFLLFLTCCSRIGSSSKESLHLLHIQAFSSLKCGKLSTVKLFSNNNSLLLQQPFHSLFFTIIYTLPALPVQTPMLN